MIGLEQMRRGLREHAPSTVPGASLMKRAAVAAIVREVVTGPELMFIRRAEHPKDPWSGHMAFPGGRVDSGDGTSFAAALRETREEIQLDLREHAEHLGRLSQLPAVGRGKRLGMVIDPYVFHLTESHVALEPDPGEVQEVVWVPLSFLLDRSNRSTLRRSYSGVPWTLPCYHFEGRIIWGLTLKMTDELLAITRAAT